jgi:hypothetical protein
MRMKSKQTIMKMKSKTCCGFIGAVLLLTSPSLLASIIGTGSLYISAPGYPPDQAGPYAISSLTSSSGSNPGSSFETFCLGTQVDYTPNSTYDYLISDTVQPASGVGLPGYVTWGTAWLYSQYRAGALGDGAVNNPEDDALQEAIWVLQGQSLSGITFSPNQTDYTAFLNDVTNAAALAHVSVTSDANGDFGVYALDMFTLSGSTTNYVQPELCEVPVGQGGTVPEPSTVLAGALLLLPCGVSVIRILRKSPRQSSTS